MASRLSAAVSIPNAHLRRGSDATVSRDINFIPELQYDLNQKAPPPTTEETPASPPGTHHHHHRVETNASNQSPMFRLLSASGSITPALLAKYHLPGILLQHGPLAIRHITAHLMASLPGFSIIPPAKQRRIVVGALEGRGGCSGAMGEVGGTTGDVIFEKVGWGRWDARKKGEPASAASATPTAMPMAVMRSYSAESGIFVQSEEEDVDMEDAMSSVSSSLDDDDEMTDEEDWAQMGAAALRRHGGSPITSDGWNSYAKSPPVGWERGREEREAVEALVKLSSV